MVVESSDNWVMMVVESSDIWVMVVVESSDIWVVMVDSPDVWVMAWVSSDIWVLVVESSVTGLGAVQDCSASFLMCLCVWHVGITTPDCRHYQLSLNYGKVFVIPSSGLHHS